MKEEIKIPDGCEVDTITSENGSVVVTFKVKDPQLPKTWLDFCIANPAKEGESYINTNSNIETISNKGDIRKPIRDSNLLPDRETAEAVLALCQLIQLRDCYNQGWKPDWTSFDDGKVTFGYFWNPKDKAIERIGYTGNTIDFLHFKDKDTYLEFVRNFADLIDKIKPMYGIKEGGEE